MAVQQIAVDAFGNALGYSLAGSSATATTGDFARMDGQGYRGEAYAGAYDGGGSTSAAWAEDVAARGFAANPLGLPTVGRTTAAIGADADNVNGLDLPADYALQSANPSDVARGDRLLRQQVNAEIDAAQVSAVRASADAYMKTSAAQAATLTNRDDSRTYRSASAGYRAAQASGLSYGGSPAAPGSGSSVAAKGASPSQALTGLPGYGDGSDLVNAEFGGGSGQAGFAQNMQAFNRNIAAAKQDVLQSIADKRLGWGTAVAAELLIPGSFTEGALGAAGPIIGKVVGSGIAVANKVPWLGTDLGAAAGRLGDELLELGGRTIDNLSTPRMNPQFGGVLVDLKVANSAESLAARRFYLNDKFGRTGNIDVDINIAGNKATIRQYVESQGLGASDAKALMTGIDLTQPVDVLKLSPGKNLWQYQSPGAPQGKWYSFTPDVTPSQLGIGPYGINRSTMSVESKVASQYTTNQSVNVLRSTSKAIEDTWSIAPYGSFVTQGGARQLFSPQKEFFSPLPN